MRGIGKNSICGSLSFSGGERHRYLHGVFFSATKVAGFGGGVTGIMGVWGCGAADLYDTGAWETVILDFHLLTDKT